MGPGLAGAHAFPAASHPRIALGWCQGRALLQARAGQRGGKGGVREVSSLPVPLPTSLTRGKFLHLVETLILPLQSEDYHTPEKVSS